MNTNRLHSGFLALVLGFMLVGPVTSLAQSDADPKAKDGQKPSIGEKKSDLKQSADKKKDSTPSKQEAAQPPRRSSRSERVRQQRERYQRQIEQQRERDRTRKKTAIEKNHSAILKAFGSMIADARKSTVEVMCDKRPVAMAVVVASEGLICTKASELSGTITCRLFNGKVLKAAVIAVHPEFDIALLKVKATNLIPIQWSDDALPLGSLLVTPGPKSDPLAIGTVSVMERQLSGGGFLGVAFKIGITAAAIDQVVPNTAAAKAGFRVDDVILKIDGIAIGSSREATEVIGGRSPNDKITLLIRRGDAEKEIIAILGRRDLSSARQSRFDRMNSLGGELSERRSDFPFVLEHDSVLDPTECGGPLVGMNGKAVGINIARAGRVSTLAIPSSRLISLIPELIAGKRKPTAEFEFGMKLKALDRLIAKHQRTLRSSANKEGAEGRIKKANEAIKKAEQERAKLESPAEQEDKP